MNIESLKPETKMLLSQIVCTAVGIFFSLLMIEGARYVGDFFHCLAIITGVLAIREAGRKKNWRVRIISLVLTGFNMFALLAYHGVEFVIR